MTHHSSIIRSTPLKYFLIRCIKRNRLIFNVCFFSSMRVSNDGPFFTVKQKINSGHIRSDPKQVPVLNNLQELYVNLKQYSPNKFLSLKPPKGLYIYGSVGSGKTMLMDIFFDSVKVTAKRRTHFNNFMADVHSRIHQLKKKRQASGGVISGKYGAFDPIKPVAKQLVKEAWLLCFDEFQVTDIADAMILKRMFTEMFHNGMVMVATSNRAPDELYKNGLQRSHFLPFITILKIHCNIISISSRDHRLSIAGSKQRRYLISGTRETKLAMDSAFRQLCVEEKQDVISKKLHVLGHKLIFPYTCGKILFTSFSDLCERPLGSADYIEIARHFNTVLIKDVPKMSLESRNQARRFILLIDTLYDNKVRLMLSAEDEARNLFTSSGKPISNDYNTRAVMDDLNIETGSENAKASLFSGSEEIFAFERTASRIKEMCSDSYWSREN